MKQLLMLAMCVFTSSAFASEGFKFNCQRTEGNIRGATRAVISGPTTEFNFRLRLQNNRGAQIDTGICNVTVDFAPCYIKDENGFPVPSDNGLLARLSERVNLGRADYFSLTVRNLNGTASFGCIRE